jgi:hypothetical protein
MEKDDSMPANTNRSGCCGHAPHAKAGEHTCAARILRRRPHVSMNSMRMRRTQRLRLRWRQFSRHPAPA